MIEENLSLHLPSIPNLIDPVPLISDPIESRPPKKVERKQWSDWEDNSIRYLVEQKGTKSWSLIADGIPGRTGKQCRERWHNHLDPSIKKDAWTIEEEELLAKTHAEIGNRWSEIAKILPGRTDNSIKNHWYSSRRRNFRKLNKEGTSILLSGSDNTFNPLIKEGVVHAKAIKEENKDPIRQEAKLAEMQQHLDFALGTAREFALKNDSLGEAVSPKIRTLSEITDPSVLKTSLNLIISICQEDATFKSVLSAKLGSELAAKLGISNEDVSTPPAQPAVTKRPRKSRSLNKKTIENNSYNHIPQNQTEYSSIPLPLSASNSKALYVQTLMDNLNDNHIDKKRKLNDEPQQYLLPPSPTLFFPSSSFQYGTVLPHFQQELYQIEQNGKHFQTFSQGIMPNQARTFSEFADFQPFDASSTGVTNNLFFTSELNSLKKIEPELENAGDEERVEVNEVSK